MARRRNRPVAVLIGLPTADGSQPRGIVLDRSPRGVRLLVSEEVAPGTPLALLPEQASSMTPRVPVEVRHCQRGEDGWEIGCQFLRTPPWPILMLFN